MNNLTRGINHIENLKFHFENADANETSYVREMFNYNSVYVVESTYFAFFCSECKCQVDIKDLKFKDNIVTCTCGHQIPIDKVYHTKHTEDYYEKLTCDMILHNINNGTHGKFNVPTILGTDNFYCNKCHETHKLNSYNREDNKLICHCGAKYTFEECKVSSAGEQYDIISSNLYFDGNKVALSSLSTATKINSNGRYFWATGNMKTTMNLETGYTYLINKGCCYTDFNKEWQRRHLGNSKAPKMFNATYCVDWGQFNTFLVGYISNLIRKYSNMPNMIKLICRHNSKLRSIIANKIFKQIDEYTTRFYNNKYDYRIKSLTELMTIDDIEFEEYDILRMFVLHNRFINASAFNLKKTIPMMLHFIKESNNKTVYRKLSRENNVPVVDFTNAFVKISKSLRKEIYNRFSNGPGLEWDDSYFMFLQIAKNFKNKEHVNKLYKTLSYSCSPIYNVNEGVDLWKYFRSEQYIANLSVDDIRKKVMLMRDSHFLIKRIQNVYGEDWDINTVGFHNEKQYHDDLMTIVDSNIFRELQDAKRKAELSEPFKMEEEVFKLADKNISIALNEYELTVIGNEMHICVGGYGHTVKNGNCRIAYIKTNDEYKVCLELRKIKNKEKVQYELHQAKLKYNSLVGSDEEMHNIVKDWCTKHNIKILTNDMKANYKKEVAVAN
jgi:hypothetical protein